MQCSLPAALLLSPPPQVDRTKMLEMFSREGECVPFETPVEARGNIEVWLQRLVEGMQVRRGWSWSRCCWCQDAACEQLSAIVIIA